MKIGFRVDSSDALGLGHLNRSITLASEFKRVGVKVFYSSNLLGNSDDLINEKGFNLTKLNKNKIRQNEI